MTGLMFMGTWLSVDCHGEFVTSDSCPLAYLEELVALTFFTGLVPTC
jgi:hypothetical protein